MKTKRHIHKRHVEEAIIKALMIASFAIVAGSLGFILLTITVKGLPAMNLAMITQTPKGGFYLGKEGGILNAIIGSLYMATGATLLSMLFSLPLALYLGTYIRRSRWAETVRLSMDVLWGIPSIVYGAFGFTIMLALGMRASLLGGILVLTLLEIPIMTRAMEEVIRMVPRDLEQASFAVGANRLETATKVVVRQMLPGIVTAIMLAFGRAIGDAASVLFTAGFSDRIPTSLFQPAASLPLAVFFQLGTPFPEVQQRAYASALILTIIVLALSFGSRWLSNRLSKNVVK
jgi:phosphate transport system permease protein